MKIINPQEKCEVPIVTTIGMFDGVHIGHQNLIRETIILAKKAGAYPAVYTFVNHPMKERKRYFVTSLDEKLFLLRKFGVEVVFLNELTHEYMKKSPEEFIFEELVGRMNLRGVIVGEDFRFGFNREGDIELLRKFLSPHKIGVNTIKMIYLNGEAVKSSNIARLIKDGSITKANELLGYKFFLSGSIVSGKGLGKHLGFPTANLKYLNGIKVLPKNGVYVTLAEIGGNILKSISSVGTNPTFESDKKIKVEVHLLDSSLDIYGEFMRLHFLEYLRDEKKFNSAEDLRKAVKVDIEKAENYLRSKEKVLPF